MLKPEFPVTESINRYSLLASRYLCVAVIVVGGTVLLGWALDITFLKSMLSEWIPMMPVTAICFIMIGFSLILNPGDSVSKFKKSLSYILASLVIIQALVNLFEVLFSFNTGINTLLFTKELYEEQEPFPGQMAPFTALSFIMAGSAVMLTDFHIKRYYPYQFIIWIVSVISFFALLDYLFWETNLYEILGIWGFIKMAIYTAVNFLLFSFALLLSRPKLGFMAMVSSDTLGGEFFRRLFPAVVIILVLLNLLTYIGYEAGLYGYEFGVALFLIASLMLLTIVLWRNLYQLGISDLERKKGSLKLTSFAEVLEKQTLLLISSNKELEQFIYVVSHDLQEPLKTIINYSELVQQKYAQVTNKEDRKYLDYLSGATSKMKVLMKNLLEYSFLGHNKIKEKIDCNLILKKVINELENEIEESKAIIEADDLPVVNGFPELYQLFKSILANAIKFRKSDIRPLIKIRAVSRDKDWLFSISDNGIGIARKYHEKVFNLFQKLHKPAQYSGTGIGLALCKKIVELHEGKIWVKSESGKGSTFYFTIPK